MGDGGNLTLTGSEIDMKRTLATLLISALVVSCTSDAEETTTTQPVTHDYGARTDGGPSNICSATNNDDNRKPAGRSTGRGATKGPPAIRRVPARRAAHGGPHLCRPLMADIHERHIGARLAAADA